MAQVAVLASGSGSNFEALVLASRRGELGGDVSTLLCDQPAALVMERAKRLGVDAHVLPTGRFRTRLADERPWIEALESRRIDLVVLAGFMRRLHADFLAAYEGRVLNIHPSLLPAFPGRRAIRDAWEHGVRVTGCTVHLVTDEVDGGPILDQEAVTIADGEPLDRLEARIHEAEHRLYPRTVRRFLTEPWQRDGRRIVFTKERAVGV